MKSLSQYTDILTRAVDFIASDNISAADWLINNYYHRQRRSGADYVVMLWLTLHHRTYVSATEETQHQLARILFLLDTKNNKRTNSVFIEFRKERIIGGEERVVFTLQERESTPAH